MGRVVHPHIITPDRALGGSIIERSVRFDGVNDYFTRTPSVNGNRQKFTLSCWVKRGQISTDDNHLIKAQTWETVLRFTSDDRLDFYYQDESYTYSRVRSNARFMDMGTWYHCVAVLDTTQATTSNRMKIYVNGEQITSLETATYPRRYTYAGFNLASNSHQLGAKPDGSNERLYGYMTEVHHIDGQALDPSYFGYTDFQTGTWRPKKYSGNHVNVNTGAVNDGSTWAGNANYFNKERVDDNASGGGGGAGAATFTGLNGSLTINFSTAVPVSSSLVLNLYASVGNTNNHCDIFINDVERTITTEDAYGGSNSGDFAIAFTGSMTKLYLNAKNSANNGLGMIIVDGEILTNGYNARGNNSFYLPFTDNSGTTATTIGRDYSGNGNNFTPTSIATTDSVLDTPSNSFAVLNPQLRGPRNNGTNASGTFSLANTKVVLTGSGDDFSATFAVSSGKWYHEVKLVAVQNHGAGWTLFDDFTSGEFKASTSGIVNDRKHLGTADSGGSSQIANNGSNSNASQNFADDDIIGFAFDIDGGRLSIYRNGTLISTITGIAAGTYVPIVGDDSSTDATLEVNFGAHAFSYTPPTGFLPLSTKNITTSGTKILKPKKHFDCLIWDGTNNASRDITGLEFKPDLVWIKNRAQGNTHSWQDSVIGFGDDKTLRTDTTNALDTNGNLYGYINYTLKDGINVNSGSDHGSSRVNSSASGAKHVAWCWKAGGSSNTFNVDGTGYASAAAAGITEGNLALTGASVNKESGFSIVKFNGNGSASATIGHGLNSRPKFVIVKDTTASDDWQCKYIDDNMYLALNNANAGSTSYSSYTATDTLINLGYTWNNGSGLHVAYSWAEIPGFSALGTYIGTGTAEGPHIFTGFKPAWVMTKRTAGGTSNWNLFDFKRPGYNPTNDRLFPNLNNVEADGSASDNQIRILSTGFKMTGSNVDTNGAGSTYFYMAFAEEPTFTPFGTQSNPMMVN